ncbi:cell wall-binding repeat-containing protein [Aquibacillus sp. 3ASR75-11]|uniref:Cell wall-binding repeat-containing protein n=1 Tax=Terrihalobacillus insolitus TaxID=2950438 RepID=A0A9X4ALP0_9BACI|nr:cell wall-binding repeat-containing protein [Terrihalobacillus insolitus]MDC3413866.1 cell wall-binding repeat-containing protein [Terrihalobacillus insolitus]MDC3424597.1 cell wall-binding repeat-containing protein [Terrihalobacillus insolitus]
MFFPFTIDTTRVDAIDPHILTVYVSQIHFPSRDIPWRPSAVVLVPSETYHFGYIGSSIVHFPINASFLFTRQDTLLPITLQEIIRLEPTGENVPAQVILLGPISQKVEIELQRYGISTMRIGSSDIFQTAAQAAYFRLVTIPPKANIGKHHIIVASAEDGAEALPAPYYSAHQGVPIIFVYKNSIPEASRWVMEQFPDRTFTIFGSEKTISRSVENKMKLIVSDVDRMEGDNPFEISVNLANRQSTEKILGWDRNKQGIGNAFSFGTIHSWQKALSGILFAHIGKHTPLLLIEPHKIPTVVGEYLLTLNPIKPRPPAPPFMHGIILGGHKDIMYDTQVKLEEHLILRALD